VFVIQGAEDYTTPVSLARSYVDALHAPRKAFTTIEGAGHFAVFTKRGRVPEGTQDPGAPVDTLERFSQIVIHVTLPIGSLNSRLSQRPGIAVVNI
jgi:pimeloyl-ACP methyl ester carboxylesterase